MTLQPVATVTREILIRPRAGTPSTGPGKSIWLLNNGSYTLLNYSNSSTRPNPRYSFTIFLRRTCVLCVFHIKIGCQLALRSAMGYSQGTELHQGSLQQPACYRHGERCGWDQPRPHQRSRTYLLAARLHQQRAERWVGLSLLSTQTVNHLPYCPIVLFDRICHKNARTYSSNVEISLNTSTLFLIK